MRSWRYVLVGVIALAPTACLRVRFQEEYFCRWLELRPAPDSEAIEQFRERFPATPVTTTQPDSWNKIEVGMTRGMVHTLVDDRLRDPRRGNVATLDQNSPEFEKWDIRLYFRTSCGDETPSADHDILEAIIVRRVVDRPIQSTDWP